MSKMSIALLLATLASFPPLSAKTQAPAPASAQEVEAVTPDSPSPTKAPPPPPSRVPTPPAGVTAPTTQEAPQGQWVYTAQYGWVWMPYGDRYTHVVVEDDTALMYLYYPVVGWCWVDAPWLWGWGPRPHFGIYGTLHFGWWGHGYGRWYGWSRPYPHTWGRGYYHGGSWHRGGGMRPGFRR